MYEDSLIVRFHNFKPRPSTKTKILSIGRQIESAAPSDAVVIFDISRRLGRYKMVCRVASAMGTFHGEGEASTAEDALEKVEESLMGSLNHWKVARFRGPVYSSPHHRSVG